MSRALTHELMHRAWNHIQEVEALGGMTKAIEPACRKCGSKKRRRAGRRVSIPAEDIVGVNKYQLETRRSIEVLRVDNQCGSRNSGAAPGAAPAAATSVRSKRRWRRLRMQPQTRMATCWSCR